MLKGRAYFTPSPENTPQIVAGLVLGAYENKPEVSFFVIPETQKDAEQPLEMIEVTLAPVEKFETTDTGYELTGRRLDAANIIGKLTVDTTVEPPVATYVELDSTVHSEI